jgi:hypothetical protein
MSPADASASAVVSELEALSIDRGGRHGNDTRAPARSRLAHGTTLILLTMSLGVLIAQIDTSVVNLAVKEIGTRLGAGVTALQWVVDAYNLVYATLLLTAIGPGRPLAAQSRMTGPDYDRPTATPRRGATP